jgi:hypothetical protein
MTWWSLPSERRRSGTRFLLYPQAPYGSAEHEPETVWLSPPAGSVGPGPSDDRMHVLDPVGKRRPYGLNMTAYGKPYLYLPPWRGPIRAPAMPDAAGHFDHLEVGTPEFEAAHAYGSARFALDVWERYFGRRIRWHFWPQYEHLEVDLLRPLDNATSGFGFMELGSDFSDAGKARPFSLNFDVIAHELGHLIIYSEVGMPAEDAIDGEYFGFHEAAADLSALVATMHFDSVLEHLLETTHGNLYTFNELNRFAELSPHTQIRIASNDRKLSDFSDGWRDEHALSEPLTGAIFDILVDIFDENLLDRGLISPEVEDLFDQFERFPEYEGAIQSLFDDAYQGQREGFREALVQARDYLGVALAETWKRLSPDHLSYKRVGEILLEVDRELSGGRYRQAIINSLRWRDIGSAVVGPRLAPPSAESHAFSARTLVPEHELGSPRLSYRERWEIARHERCGQPGALSRSRG